MSQLALVVAVACVVADVPHGTIADRRVRSGQMTTIATVVAGVRLPRGGISIAILIALKGDDGQCGSFAVTRREAEILYSSLSAKLLHA